MITASIHAQQMAVSYLTRSVHDAQQNVALRLITLIANLCLAQ